MLPVGIDDEHRLGRRVRRKHAIETLSHGVALSPLPGRAHQLDVQLARQSLELARDRLRRAVVDDHEPADVALRLLDELA
jgi:hypothetical protein